MNLNKLDREGRTRSSTDVARAVVDPGFLREITNPEGSGVPTYYSAKFSPKKLHENEETGLRWILLPPSSPDPPLMYMGLN